MKIQTAIVMATLLVGTGTAQAACSIFPEQEAQCQRAREESQRELRQLERERRLEEARQREAYERDRFEAQRLERIQQGQGAADACVFSGGRWITGQCYMRR